MHDDTVVRVMRFFTKSTPEARQVVFWARYQVTTWGGTQLQPEHLLLGLIRQDPSLVGRFLSPKHSVDQVRADLVRSFGGDANLVNPDDVELSFPFPPGSHQKPTSQEVPLAEEAGLALIRALEEAEEEYGEVDDQTAQASEELNNWLMRRGPSAMTEAPPEIIQAFAQMEEAGHRGDPGFVRAKHILIAILSAPQLPAAQILSNYGLTVEEVRKRL